VKISNSSHHNSHFIKRSRHYLKNRKRFPHIFCLVHITEKVSYEHQSGHEMSK